jgi:hypothetical protein
MRFARLLKDNIAAWFMDVSRYIREVHLWIHPADFAIIKTSTCSALLERGRKRACIWIPFKFGAA